MNNKDNEKLSLLDSEFKKIIYFVVRRYITTDISSVRYSEQVPLRYIYTNSVFFI